MAKLRRLALRLGPLLLAGCATVAPGPTVDDAAPTTAARAARVAGGATPVDSAAPVAGAGAPMRRVAEGPATVDLRQLESLPEPPREARPGGQIERPISDAEVERLRELAAALEPSRGVNGPGLSGAGRLGATATSPTLLDGFEGPMFGEVGPLLVPPDPELAVGPDHLVAVFNSGLAVYDKSGALLVGPISLASLFNTTPGCDGLEFDPNALYDEQADRFFVGADGGGRSYCMAVTAGPDPTLTWHTYAFATDPVGAFFDYPHAGVGREAIFMGANIFAGPFLEARVWAIDKNALYAGAPAPAVVNRSTGASSTPQPANLHGFAQATWPLAGPHYILTDDTFFSGSRFGVWTWDDPFGANQLTFLGEVDLEVPSGVEGGMPLPVPQDGPLPIASNDWRVLDAEYRNGEIWGTQTIACNPGAGTVNCVRWARIDPAVPAVLEAGVLGSDGTHRIFADSGVTHCGDLALGYTRSGASSFPSIAFSGRRAGQPPGLGPEIDLRLGDLYYEAFDSPYDKDGNIVGYRWGDYTGMTSDPDGLGFWYLGEYSRDLGAGAPGWGLYVGALAYTGCPILVPAPTSLDFGAWEVDDPSSPLELVLANPGDTPLAITGMTLSDPAHFFLDVGGGADPCYSTMPTLPAGQSCTVELTFEADAQGSYDGVLSLDSALDANRRDLPLAALGYVPCPYSPEADVTNGAEQNGLQQEFACVRLNVGPYQLGPSGRLELTAGSEVVFREDTVLAGELVVTLDPFLALP